MKLAGLVLLSSATAVRWRIRFGRELEPVRLAAALVLAKSGNSATRIVAAALWRRARFAQRSGYCGWN